MDFKNLLGTAGSALLSSTNPWLMGIGGAASIIGELMGTGDEQKKAQVAAATNANNQAAAQQVASQAPAGTATPLPQITQSQIDPMQPQALVKPPTNLGPLPMPQTPNPPIDLVGQQAATNFMNQPKAPLQMLPTPEGGGLGSLITGSPLQAQPALDKSNPLNWINKLITPSN